MLTLDAGVSGSPLLGAFLKQLSGFLEGIIKGEDKVQYVRALELLLKLSLPPAPGSGTVRIE